MKLLAQHPYIKVERKIVGLEQVEIEHSRTIYLFEEKVVTEHREFPIHLVTDFSYKAIANEGGLLYLHTLRGVYTYQVKCSPRDFMAAYNAYVKR